MVLTRKRRAIEARGGILSSSANAVETPPKDGSVRGDPDALLALPFDILLEVIEVIRFEVYSVLTLI